MGAYVAAPVCSSTSEIHNLLWPNKYMKVSTDIFGYFLPSLNDEGTFTCATTHNSTVKQTNNTENTLITEYVIQTNLNCTWKVLVAPPQLNLRQRLTLLSFSKISKVPSFHLVVPRSILVNRILTAPPLESLGTKAAMAYYPDGALGWLGLGIKQILNKRDILCVSITTAKSNLQNVDYHHYTLNTLLCHKILCTN